MLPEQIHDLESWTEWREKTEFAPLDLAYVSFDEDDLSGYDFRDVHFEKCSFRRTILYETTFEDATLTRCNFRDAKFWKTNFEGVDCRTCFFNDLPINCSVDGALISRRQEAMMLGYFRRMKVQ